MIITRNEVIEFCKERTAMHFVGAQGIKEQKDTDELNKLKYNSLMDLANKYKAIRMFLQDPSITAIDMDEEN